MGHRQYLSNKGRANLLNKSNILLLSSTTIWGYESLTVKMMRMNSNNDSDNQDSRSNSLSLSVAVWTVKSFRYSIWECFKEPIRSCSADPYKSWRTAHGSSSAHGKPGGTVPHSICFLLQKMGCCLVCYFFLCCSFASSYKSNMFFCSHCILIFLAFSHCILLCPFSCWFVVLFPVSLVCMGDLWYKWVIRVWITKKRTDRQ